MFSIQKHLIHHKAASLPQISTSAVCVSLQLLGLTEVQRRLHINPTGLHKNLSQKVTNQSFPANYTLRGSSERILLLHWRSESSRLHANGIMTEIVTRWEAGRDFPNTQQNIQVMLTQWACFTNTVAQSRSRHMLHDESIRILHAGQYNEFSLMRTRLCKMSNSCRNNHAL